MGGVEKYITDLGRIFTDNGRCVTVYQYSDEDSSMFYEGFVVQNVKGASSPKDIINYIENKEPDFENDILIFSTDFLICRHHFRRSIAIQHGVAWDTAKYSASSSAGNYLAMIKNCLRAVRKYLRFRFCSEIACVDYNFINWYRTQVKAIDINLYGIPNYARVPETPAVRNNDRISIVFSRRLVEYRGTRLFADAISEILNEYPKVSVTIAGSSLRTIPTIA